MKKLLALLLTGILTLSMVGCGEKPAEEPDNTTMPADMASMTEPVDALARCMLENHLDYAPEDTEFFWTAMFYFAGGYGLQHSLAAEHDETYQLILPTSAMQEYAAALFAGCDTLPELTENMEGNISYHPDENAYFLSRGDIGLSELTFTSYEKTDDGYALTAELRSTEPDAALIAAWDVLLVDNAYADSIENPLYHYSVAKLTLLESSDDIPAIQETAVFNGLADSHTVELTLSDGTVQAFQFDANSNLANIIGSLKEGDGLTIQYTEPANGGPLIISVE